MSHKNKVGLLVAVIVLALVQMACAGNPDPGYSGSEGEKLDAKIVATIQAAPAQIKAGLDKAGETCFAGLATGDTGKIVNGPCESPLPK